MKKIEIPKGNSFWFDVVLDTPDPLFDWSTVTIRAELKENPEDPVALHEFEIVPTYDTGTVSFQLYMPGSLMEGLPTVFYGDIRIERESPVFGPYNVFPFQITQTIRVTGP